MINIRINYLVIVIVSIISVGVIALNIEWPNQQQDQVKRIISRGELRVSTINSPLMSFNDNQEASGFDYELTKRFADYLGVKLRINVRSNINQLFNDLENGNSDFITAGLLYNEKRLDRVQPGPAYYTVSQQLIYRKGINRPRSLNDIKGKFVVATDSVHASTLQRLKQKYPNLQWEETSHYNATELLQLLAEGKIDYTLENSIVVAMQQRIHPNIAVAFNVSDDHSLNWYMKRSKDNSLNAAMLDFFNKSKEEELLTRLDEKYFGHVASFDYFDTLSFITAINKTLPTYKHLFKKYAEDMDWRLLAAISWQESHWDPLATSPTGVRGLMMLTVPTAQTMGVSDRLDPEESIKGGAAYLQYLMSRLPTTIAPDDRIWFALSAYNMGLGHMLDARKLTRLQGGDPDSWLDVKARLPLLSKKKYFAKLTYGYARGYEAYRYVENIRRYHQSLVGYLQNKEMNQNMQLAARDPLLFSRASSKKESSD
ncbi:MAG TPA: membrane-bound lytic murein transglycosylase MltF [Arsenophonus nasoniae]|uniref:membrane-bound lytic murein transglycosylase MltF n=1 Tax=Arsenophonus nasoniae TaxID=638 RepID=UPI00387955C2